MNCKIVRKNYPASAEKVRLVADLLRGKKIDQAIRCLRFCERREISLLFAKMINSGLDRIYKQDDVDLDKLVVSKVQVDQAKVLKRIQPRAQGRAFRVRHRSSHITIELSVA